MLQKVTSLLKSQGVFGKLGSCIYGWPWKGTFIARRCYCDDPSRVLWPACSLWKMLGLFAQMDLNLGRRWRKLRPFGENMVVTAPAADTQILFSPAVRRNRGRPEIKTNCPHSFQSHHLPCNVVKQASFIKRYHKVLYLYHLKYNENKQ